MIARGNSLRPLQQCLQDGFECEVQEGKVCEQARLKVVRTKNKFATLDPTHFRNILTNLKLSWGSRWTFVEIQIHHHDIFQYNEECHAHDNYNFFRARLKDQYESELDSELDLMLTFLDEVKGTPVLLSLLVLIFASNDTNADSAEPMATSTPATATTSVAPMASSVPSRFPSSRYELYTMATQLVIERRVRGGLSVKDGEESLRQRSEAAEGLLRTISMVNQLDAKNRREFTTQHLKDMLDANEFQQWRELCEQPDPKQPDRKLGPPLIKVIDEDEQGEGVYQFKHLSFQEGLAASMLIRRLSAITADKFGLYRFTNEDATAVTELRGALAPLPREKRLKYLREVGVDYLFRDTEAMPAGLYPCALHLHTRPGSPCPRRLTRSSLRTVWQLQ